MINRGTPKVRTCPKIEPKFDSHTKLEKIELFDKLVFEAIKLRDIFARSVSEQRVAASVNASRSMYQLILAAPSLAAAFNDNPLTATNITSDSATDIICSRLKISGCSFDPAKVNADLTYIGKIMGRYKLNFPNAFNFWAFRNELKSELNYTSKTNSKFGNRVDEVQKDILLKVCGKLGLQEKDLNEILPALEAKMHRSYMKTIIAKQQAGLFASNADFNKAVKELETIAKLSKF